MNKTDLETRQLSWRKLSFLWVSFLTTHRCWETEHLTFFRVVKMDLKSKSRLPVCYEIHTDDVCASIAMNPENITSVNHKMGVISSCHNRGKMYQRAEASIDSALLLIVHFSGLIHIVRLISLSLKIYS